MRLRAAFFLILGFSLLPFRNGHPQLPDHRPLVLKLRQFPAFVGKNSGNLFLLSYQDSSGSWHAAAFQIDPGFAGRSPVPGSGYVVQPTDELVTLMSELGDAAPEGTVPEISGLKALQWYEIQIDDPLLGQSGTLYFCEFSAPVPVEVPDLISVDPVHDEISSPYYRVGFNAANGLPASLFLLPDLGGKEVDLLDALKIRLAVSVSVIGQPVDVNLDEENSFQVVPASEGWENPRYFDGSVRALRNVGIQIQLDIGNGQRLPLPDTFQVELEFYPRSVRIFLPGLDLAPLQQFNIILKQVRFSFDYTPAVIGHMFLNPRNTLPVDGNPDPYDPVVQPGQLNWMMVTGHQGAIFHAASVPDIGEVQRLYYHDSKIQGSSGDGTEDTGDGVSIGDSGYLLKGNITSGRIDFILESFFLPPGSDREAAEDLFLLLQNPPLVQVGAFRTSAVSSGTSRVPDSVRLFPTVVRPGRFAGFRVEGLPARVQSSLRADLLNLLGQRVGPLDVARDGKRFRIFVPAASLAPGVYWVRLRWESGRFSTRVLVLP